jgi:hypothetical protein
MASFCGSLLLRRGSSCWSSEPFEFFGENAADSRSGALLAQCAGVMFAEGTVHPLQEVLRELLVPKAPVLANGYFQI